MVNFILDPAIVISKLPFSNSRQQYHSPTAIHTNNGDYNGNGNDNDNDMENKMDVGINNNNYYKNTNNDIEQSKADWGSSCCNAHSIPTKHTYPNSLFEMTSTRRNNDTSFAATATTTMVDQNQKKKSVLNENATISTTTATPRTSCHGHQGLKLSLHGQIENDHNDDQHHNGYSVVTLSSNQKNPTSCKNDKHNADDEDEDDDYQSLTLRQIAINASLYFNVFIVITKIIAYWRTRSLSVLAALLDSILDVVSMYILQYTEQCSASGISDQYPAGRSKMEPIGILASAVLMGISSVQVLEESIEALIFQEKTTTQTNIRLSFWSMFAIVLTKLVLLWLCQKGATTITPPKKKKHKQQQQQEQQQQEQQTVQFCDNNSIRHHVRSGNNDDEEGQVNELPSLSTSESVSVSVPVSDPTLEALAQDHWNDCLSNGVAAIALLFVSQDPAFWCLDPIGAMIISLYILYSWYCTGKEQIEQLTGKTAPSDFLTEIRTFIVQEYSCADPMIVVDVIRAYHFGPKYLVEIEIVLSEETTLLESHDIGVQLQHTIESRKDVERCFVHIDYQTRPYDEHIISKDPELLELYSPRHPSHSHNHRRRRRRHGYQHCPSSSLSSNDLNNHADTISPMEQKII